MRTLYFLPIGFFASCAVVKTDNQKAIVPLGAQVTFKDSNLSYQKPLEITQDILDFLSPRNLISSTFHGIADGLAAFKTNDKNK